MSADGRYVAFNSEADNLVPGDTNGIDDLFVYDRVTGGTVRVNVKPDGSQSSSPSYWRPVISGDGGVVAWATVGSDLIPGEERNPGDDIIVRDLRTGTNELASVNSSGQEANNSSYEPSLSDDGRFVAFESYATNLVANDANQDRTDVFVHDRYTGETSMVSVSSDGIQGNRASYSPQLSADGLFVAYSSIASNLVPGDTNGVIDTFVHNTRTGVTTRVSVTSEEVQAGGGIVTDISPDGRFVVFLSGSPDLVPGDTNGRIDAFVRDLVAGTTIRVNLSSQGTQANYDARATVISDDGNRVAFYTSASNLVRRDTNWLDDIFVRDLVTGRTVRISLRPGGEQTNQHNLFPTMSGDGSIIAFDSYDSDLVPPDENNSYDVFVFSSTI